MRIAILIDIYKSQFVGGGQNSLESMITHLKQEGHEVVVFHGIQVAFWRRILWIFRVIPQVIFAHQKKPFDVIDAQPFVAGIPAKFLNLWLQVPVVYWIRGSHTLDIMADKKLRVLPQFQGLGFTIKYFLEKFLLTQIAYNAQISVSRNFSQHQNINKNIKVIVNAIDDVDRKYTKNKFVDNKNSLTFLYVGRLDTFKGLEFLFQSLEKVGEKLGNWQLRIVGEGGFKTFLQNELAKLPNKVSGRIVFVGQKKDKELQREYLNADMFILPSLAEGQPRVILEAWKYGLPVITTRVGHNDAMIEDCQSGFLSETGDADSLSKTILRALEKRKDWADISQKAKIQLIKEHDWNKITNDIIKVYEEVSR